MNSSKCNKFFNQSHSLKLFWDKCSLPCSHISFQSEAFNWKPLSHKPSFLSSLWNLHCPVIILAHLAPSVSKLKQTKLFANLIWTRFEIVSLEFTALLSHQTVDVLPPSLREALDLIRRLLPQSEPLWLLDTANVHLLDAGQDG